jgi:hypothetical protein
MTISTTNITKSYNGNGSTHSFVYDFPIFADADLTVIVRSSTGAETTKTLNTHYVVTGAGASSGGNVLFKYNTGNSSDAHYSLTDQRPANGETVVIRSELSNTQTLDLVANDPFPASSFETALDRLVRMVQQHDEELDRSIKLSRTNTMTSTEFTNSATDRASKVLAFDSSGELSVTTELGTFKGNWAASTTYALRDIVKDTSTNNIFIATTAHTSSGSQPLTTNTDSAKWSLLVDAASATASQNAAAASAASASADATSTAADVVTTNADVVLTNADVVTTGNNVTAAQAAQAAAEAAADDFTDRYYGAHADDSAAQTYITGQGLTVDTGDLYFNTTSNVLKIYNGSAWQVAAISTTGLLASANDLSDLTSAATARVNLGSTAVGDAVFIAASVAAAQQALDVEVGVDVQAYDADTAKLDVAQTFTAAQAGSTQTASITGSTTLDFSVYQNFVLTLTGTVTLDNPTTETIGQSGFIIFIQDSTGGYTVSLGTDYETAGASGLTLSSTADTTDIVPYVVAANGRILLGAPQLAFA